MARQSWWRRLWYGREPVAPPTDEPAPPAAREPTLEAEIARTPDAVDPYLVYGDWLQERGDPRGTLISLQARCTLRADHGRSNGPVRTLAPWRVLDGEYAAAARDLVARFPIRLGGDLDPHEHAEWYCGYWRRLRLEPPDVQNATQPLKARLASVLHHASARFLRTLSLGYPAYRDVVKHLPQLPSTLETLHLGTPTYPGDADRAFGFGSIAPLATCAPGLEQLVLQGPALDLGPRIDLPRLRALELVTRKLSAGALHAIARSDLPRLETLILWLADADVEPDAVRALIDARMPSLRELRLVECAFVDDALAALVAAPWISQLRVLDLSNGALTARGVRILEDARERLENLEQVDISGNPLDADAVARVASLSRRAE